MSFHCSLHTCLALYAGEQRKRKRRSRRKGERGRDRERRIVRRRWNAFPSRLNEILSKTSHSRFNLIKYFVARVLLVRDTCFFLRASYFPFSTVRREVRDPLIRVTTRCPSLRTNSPIFQTFASLIVENLQLPVTKSIAIEIPIIPPDTLI